MEAKIILEGGNNSEMSVVWEYKHTIHTIVKYLQSENNTSNSIFSSTNTLKIYSRDELRDDFKYEVVFCMLTTVASVNNIIFSVYCFDDTDDMSILNVICAYFNKYHDLSLTIEQGEVQYILRNRDEIILQSFF